MSPQPLDPEIDATPPSRSVWMRLERLLPLAALLLCLAVGAAVVAGRHSNAHLEYDARVDGLRNTAVSSHGTAVRLAAAEGAHLEEVADRITTMSAERRTASAIMTVLGLDAIDRVPAALGALSIPAADSPSRTPDLFGFDNRIQPLVSQGAELAERLRALVALYNDTEVFLAQLEPVTALVVTADDGSAVALLLETRTFLGDLEYSSGPVTTTITPFAGVGTDVIEATPIIEDDGTMHIVDTLDLLGSTLRVETSSTSPIPPPPALGDRFLDISLALAGAALVFLTTRWLVQSQIAATVAAQKALDAQRLMDLRFRTSFERSPMGIAEIDGQARLVDVNPALCRQVGADRTRLIGMSVSVIVHPEDRAQWQAKFRAVSSGTNDAARSEHRYVRADGSVVWVDESLSVVSDMARDTKLVLLQAQDVTARRNATSELARQAFHDDLTGLPNRALFLNRLRKSVEGLSRRDGHAAVMFIDVDRFKVINDSLGHEAGDAFLREIAQRLSGAVRAADTVARFGGDEFVVLLEEVSGASETYYLAGRIQEALARPFDLGVSQLPGASASIGITISDAESTSAEDLLRDADAAMYRAKENGRNRVELFDASLRHEVVARMEIEGQLRRALTNGEMVMHYQAIVDADTGLPAGYEALIRWNHPEQGLLGPGAFLHVAEDAGVMHLIDAFALRAACRQIAEWSARHPGFRRMYVSTNWSARQLEHYVSLTEQTLAEAGIDPSQLVIEVTEGFLLEDIDGSMQALRRLKDLGVRVAIDDFGTGYSSLSYLTRLDVDFLKVDRSFVVQLPDPASAAIIRAIADMAGRLNMGLIVEGVESDEQLHFLRQIGSPRLQGYRFSKPRWPSEIDEQLTARFAPAAKVIAATS